MPGRGVPCRGHIMHKVQDATQAEACWQNDSKHCWPYGPTPPVHGMACRVVSRYRAAIAALMYPCSALCAWRAIASASARSVPSSGSTSNRSNATESVARSPCCATLFKRLHPALLPVASRVVARCISLHSEEPTQTAYCALWDASRRTTYSTHSTITYRTAYACRRVESCGGCAPVAKTTHRSLQCAQQTNTQAAVAEVRRSRTQPQTHCSAAQRSCCTL
jgi:hypothetical protein